MSEPIKKQYYPSGAMIYKDRDRADRIRFCEAFMYWQFDPISGTTRKVFEHPCGCVQGDLVCPRCISRVSYRREKEFEERVKRAGRGTFFEMTAVNSIELRRIRQQCAYHGIEFFALPTGKQEEKYVLLTGELGGSRTISEQNSILNVRQLAGVRGFGNISGSLGKGNGEVEAKEESRDGKIKIVTRALVGQKDIDDTTHNSALLAAMIQMGRVDITEDTAQDIIAQREEDFVSALRGLGVKVALGGNVREEYLSLDTIKKNFVTVVITAGIEGNDSLLSPALYSSTQDYINNVYKFVRAQAAKIKEPTTKQVGLDAILESIGHSS